MSRYVTGDLKHVFEWESEERVVRVLADTESWLVVAAQVRRGSSADSFTEASRYEMKDLQFFYFQKNTEIFERPADFGLTACDEDQLPGWVTD